VQHQPALLDRAIEAGLLFSGRALELEQKWPVDLLDIDPAVLDRLERVGELNQLARGGLGNGERTWRDEFDGLASALEAITRTGE
jgi:hypothetical protein